MTPSDNSKQQSGTQAAMVRATRRALHEAKIHGETVPLWRDGQVVWVQPDEVEPPREEEERSQNTGP
jgi:hypothetical protein